VSASWLAADLVIEGAICCGAHVGPVGDGEELSWQRVGQLSSSVIVGPVGLRLHDWGRKLAIYDSVAFRSFAGQFTPNLHWVDVLRGSPGIGDAPPAELTAP
jgi:hypothetical protein